jgi:hypothetical protein
LPRLADIAGIGGDGSILADIDRDSRRWPRLARRRTRGIVADYTRNYFSMLCLSAIILGR